MNLTYMNYHEFHEDFGGFFFFAQSHTSGCEITVKQKTPE